MVHAWSERFKEADQLLNVRKAVDLRANKGDRLLRTHPTSDGTGMAPTPLDRTMGQDRNDPTSRFELSRVVDLEPLIAKTAERSTAEVDGLEIVHVFLNMAPQYGPTKAEIKRSKQAKKASAYIAKERTVPDGDLPRFSASGSQRAVGDKYSVEDDLPEGWIDHKDLAGGEYTGLSSLLHQAFGLGENKPTHRSHWATYLERETFELASTDVKSIQGHADQGKRFLKVAPHPGQAVVFHSGDQPKHPGSVRTYKDVIAYLLPPSVAEPVKSFYLRAFQTGFTEQVMHRSMVDCACPTGTCTKCVVPEFEVGNYKVNQKLPEYQGGVISKTGEDASDHAVLRGNVSLRTGVKMPLVKNGRAVSLGLIIRLAGFLLS